MNIPSLISDLHNDDDGIRWKACQELAKCGYYVVDEVLEDLCHSVLDERLCQMYLFIFEQQRSRATVERLKRVIVSLRSVEFREESPVAAEKALGVLRLSLNEQASRPSCFESLARLDRV